jgi:hypothetical protein
MLDALNIVKGAVSTKDLIPVLTHVAIDQGRITGFNGRTYISAPAPQLQGLSFTVPAAQFIAAVAACEGPAEYTQGEGCLGVSSGDFSATLPTLPIEGFPQPPPPEKRKRWKGGLLPVLRLLRPFVSQDASRPWSAGIAFAGAKALATNNVVLAQAPFPTLATPSVTLPVEAVDELLRLGLDPLYVSFTASAACFYLPGEVQLWTNLVAEPWPDGALALVGQLHQGAQWTPVPPGLLSAVRRVLPFVADAKAPVVVLGGGSVKTSPGQPACAQVGGFTGLQGTFRAEPLQLVLEVANQADWTRFPRVPWKGAGVDGAIVGILA